MNLDLLTDQGSNLDSSEPKSDVLPVTPSVNFGLFYYSLLLRCHKCMSTFFFMQVRFVRFLDNHFNCFKVSAKSEKLFSSQHVHDGYKMENGAGQNK